LEIPMVILIASDQSKVRRGLADRLREMTGQKVLTAASVAEMETMAVAEGALDLLLFSPVFSIGGKEARARLRERYPELLTVALVDGLSLDQLVTLVMQWLPAVETISRGGGGVAEPEGGKLESLGDYDLIELLRTTDRTLIYKAVQRSVKREVALERLRPELAAQPAAAREFRRMVRASALVSHPAIAAVYEAQEADGEIFYTRELVRGKNLTELAADRAHFPQDVLLQMLLTTAEAFTWMQEHQIPHEPVLPGHLYLGSNGTPRVANIAQPEGNGAEESAVAMPVLAEACLRLAEPRSGQTRELSHLLGLMKARGPHAVTSWKQLAREARQGLQRLAEAHTSLLPESRARQLARRRLQQKQALLVLAAVAAGWAVVSWWRQSSRAKVRDVADIVLIPAGEYIFRDGQKRTLSAFTIDRYEVTLADYSAFLDALPHGEPNRFDHPDQPGAKTGHLPRDWAEVTAAARAAGKWKGHPITLNAPVFNVDWWDAWAYARWKGRRLPTEEEWEKAARGPEGHLWPWGNKPDPSRANTGSDYSDQPSTGGQIDGHAWWCDVDAMPGDVSTYGVGGLAGNVSEWTGTLVPDPDLPDLQVPVFRGGDFHQTVPVPLNVSPWLAKGALYSQPFLGFRTAAPLSSP
jgi:formylglycine-generating enzyme required for sulfatase activity